MDYGIDTEMDDISIIGENLSMKLHAESLKGFHVAKRFHDFKDKINGLDFSASGDLLVASGVDDQIHIYDCEKGALTKTLNSKKYGVDHIHFTHAKNTVVHSSTKVDNTIRYLSLHDNKYLRYFIGHLDKVTNLCMSPLDDTFLSASQDKSVRLWDLRSPNCQGLMHLTGNHPVAAFDPDGVIFAVGMNNNTIKLYDVRTFDQGPFSTFLLPEDLLNEWESIKFSPDGKYIMISCFGNIIRLIDAYEGVPFQTFADRVNPTKLPMEASFTPDSKYIVSGSADCLLYVWDVESGHRVCVLDGEHSGPVQCVQFNPKYMMIASACTNLSFWIPSGRHC